MVDRDAQVEAAFVIEVDDLVWRVRRGFVADVAERAAVAHRLHRRAWRGVEAEELSHSCPVEAVALGQGVFPGGTGQAVHDRLGDQQAVDDVLAQGLVGVQVVALPDPQRSTAPRWRSRRPGRSGPGCRGRRTSSLRRPARAGRCASGSWTAHECAGARSGSRSSAGPARPSVPSVQWQCGASSARSACTWSSGAGLPGVDGGHDPVHHPAHGPDAGAVHQAALRRRLPPGSGKVSRTALQYRTRADHMPVKSVSPLLRLR